MPLNSHQTPRRWAYADYIPGTIEVCPQCNATTEFAIHVEQTGNQETCQCANCGLLFMRTITQVIDDD